MTVGHSTLRQSFFSGYPLVTLPARVDDQQNGRRDGRRSLSYQEIARLALAFFLHSLTRLPLLGITARLTANKERTEEVNRVVV